MKTQQEYEASIARTGIVAGCVIHDGQGRYLLVQEAQKKVYGLWNLPAGYVDKGETIETAAVREAKEETNLDVEIVCKLGIWHSQVERPVKHAYLVNIVGGKMQYQPNELLDAKWFSYGKIQAMEKAGSLRAEWVLEAITTAEKQSQQKN